MTQRKPLSISVDMNTDKLQLKLRAIAKHNEALAKALDAINNAWQCECGSDEYEDAVLMSGKDTIRTRRCLKCGDGYYSLPTQLESIE